VTLRLIRASVRQQASRDVLTASAWGQGLSGQQFLQREQQLRGHAWAAAALRSWWWVDAQGAPLASCETFEVDSCVGEAPGVAHLIASVFVEPALRGQGHASAMLRAVLAAARRPTSQAFVLFSEVGVALYARVGFRAAPAVDLVLPAGAGRPLPTATRVPAVRRSLGSLSLERASGFIDWQQERERAYAALLQRTAPPTATAECEGATIGWTAYFKTGELHVLWLDEAPVATRARLLEAARAAAFDSGLAQVRVWEQGDGAWTGGLPGVRIVPRDDEVPMYLPLVSGIERWAPIERATWA
jgi:predicted N-acetyltransferase YhbS